MSGHDRRAPSAAHRWMNCPGSVSLAETLPPEPESPYAAEGTFAHAVAAKALNELRDVSELIGFTDGIYTVDAEMAQHLQMYVDAVLACTNVPSVEIKAKYCTGPIFISGTVDAFGLVEGNHLHVFDLKYGKGVYVPVEDNPQMMIYALAVINTFAHCRQHARTITMHIVQPRHPQGGHKTHTISREQLFTWGREELAPAALAVDTTPDVRVAGDHCKFCPAKSVCPEIKDVGLSIAKKAFAPDAKAAIAQLTPEQMGELIGKFPLIVEWMKSVEDHATALAKAGTNVPGYVLEGRYGHRKWIDGAEDVIPLYTAECYEKPKLKTPAQLEKAIPKDIVNSLTTRPELPPKLVPVAKAKNPVAGVFEAL